MLSLIVGSATFLLIYAVFGVDVAPEPPVHRRIAKAVGIQRQTLFEQPIWMPMMALMLGIARRVGWPSLRQTVRQRLNASGNPSGYSVDEFIAICLFSGTLAVGAALALQLLAGGSFLMITGPAFAAFGFVGPLYLLKASADARVSRIGRQLPYTMDLIALTMAAGSTFPEAIRTLIRDDPEEDLNVELDIVLSEMDYGTTRAAALSNLADRIPLESLRSIVGAINQAESLGTPLSNILKLQADMLRNARSVRAEKVSASASLRILVPSMLILLAVVIILFGPTIILPALRGELLF